MAAEGGGIPRHLVDGALGEANTHSASRFSGGAAFSLRDAASAAHAPAAEFRVAGPQVLDPDSFLKGALGDEEESAGGAGAGGRGGGGTVDASAEASEAREPGKFKTLASRFGNHVKENWKSFLGELAITSSAGFAVRTGVRIGLVAAGVGNLPLLALTGAAGGAASGYVREARRIKREASEAAGDKVSLKEALRDNPELRKRLAKATARGMFFGVGGAWLFNHLMNDTGLGEKLDQAVRGLDIGGKLGGVKDALWSASSKTAALEAGLPYQEPGVSTPSSPYHINVSPLDEQPQPAVPQEGLRADQLPEPRQLPEPHTPDLSPQKYIDETIVGRTDEGFIVTEPLRPDEAPEVVWTTVPTEHAPGPGGQPGGIVNDQQAQEAAARAAAKQLAEQQAAQTKETAAQKAAQAVKSVLSATPDKLPQGGSAWETSRHVLGNIIGKEVDPRDPRIFELTKALCQDSKINWPAGGVTGQGWPDANHLPTNYQLNYGDHFREALTKLAGGDIKVPDAVVQTPTVVEPPAPAQTLIAGTNSPEMSQAVFETTKHLPDLDQTMTELQKTFDSPELPYNNDDAINAAIKMDLQHFLERQATEAANAHIPFVPHDLLDHAKAVYLLQELRSDSFAKALDLNTDYLVPQSPEQRYEDLLFSADTKPTASTLGSLIALNYDHLFIYWKQAYPSEDFPTYLSDLNKLVAQAQTGNADAKAAAMERLRKVFRLVPPDKNPLRAPSLKNGLKAEEVWKKVLDLVGKYRK